MIGTTISHYKIIEKLGEGGMGVVYKAEDTKLTRTVALKFLAKHTLQSEQEKARFLREAQAASLLDHPNICTLYDTYEIEGETFIAMAYCDGQRLDEKLAMGPLPVDEAVNMAIQVAEGLKEAHDKGIIHRDIKSANIMITEKGQAKIMDFGLAKLSGRTKLTETSTIMGTVDYMSPEQARGETVDQRTDIWSLGVVLYEMLADKPPFNAESDAAMVHKIIYEEPADLRSIAPDTPSGLIAVVSRAMAKDRDKRYASAAEFLEDLRNYEFLPPEKLAFSKKRSGTRALSTAARVMPRRRRISAVVAAVAILAFLSVALFWLFQRPETSERAQPSKKDQEIHFCTTSDGVRIAYATSGEGDPPIVRVLGWFTHLEYEWENPRIRALWDTIGAGHLFVRYDGRGMGLSDRIVSDFSLEGRVHDLEAVIDDLKLKRFALYALSEGGPTAITYAVRHPERVSHLVLYGSWARGRRFRDTVEEQQKLEAMVMMVRQGWGSDVPAYRQYFTGLFLPDADGEAIRMFTELQRVSTSAENAIAKISVSHEIDVRPLLKQVRVPTLVIHRRGDAIVPFEMGREIAAGIPGARFLSLEGRNHVMLPEEPELEILKRTMEQFLSEDHEAKVQMPRDFSYSFNVQAELPPRIER